MESSLARQTIDAATGHSRCISVVMWQWHAKVDLPGSEPIPRGRQRCSGLETQPVLIGCAAVVPCRSLQGTAGSSSQPLTRSQQSLFQLPPCSLPPPMNGRSLRETKSREKREPKLRLSLCALFQLPLAPARRRPLCIQLKGMLPLPRSPSSTVSFVSSATSPSFC